MVVSVASSVNVVETAKGIVFVDIAVIIGVSVASVVVAVVYEVSLFVLFRVVIALSLDIVMFFVMSVGSVWGMFVAGIVMGVISV